MLSMTVTSMSMRRSGKESKSTIGVMEHLRKFVIFFSSISWVDFLIIQYKNVIFNVINVTNYVLNVSSFCREFSVFNRTINCSFVFVKLCFSLSGPATFQNFDYIEILMLNKIVMCLGKLLITLKLKFYYRLILRNNWPLKNRFCCLVQLYVFKLFLKLQIVLFIGLLLLRPPFCIK